MPPLKAAGMCRLPVSPVRGPLPERPGATYGCCHGSMFALHAPKLMLAAEAVDATATGVTSASRTAATAVIVLPTRISSFLLYQPVQCIR